MVDKSIFYDYQKLWSYGCYWNFVIGGRGTGKSYGIKKFVANRFLKYGEEFVYIRRHATELKKSLMKSKVYTFWNQLQDDEICKNHKMTNTLDAIFIDDKICGYPLALSTSLTDKSSTFDNVKTIIFDEYTLKKGAFYNYLPDDVELTLDLCETIGRLRDDIRVIFLGNFVSVSNPLFDYFNLHIPYESEFQTFKDNLIVVNAIRNNDSFREVKRKTKFGKLISNTPYGDFNIENESLTDNNVFLRKKGQSHFCFNIKANNSIYGVWDNYKEQYAVVSNDYQKNSEIMFTLKPSDHEEDTILISHTEKPIAFLLEKYRMASLFFESNKIKNNILSILDSYI